ncbi:hypothetical protein GSI_13715 [Ganoderma sinense ZZ0214-1]|uniref:Uncharacterized protein n=1 Tax=Ganoderma sinense ZZ0214-1 TaxID=1077348 RepID=A0A2G8RR28_9APHY|nr:hypothetical protein GSI_13715 [Ganoderma sinense ZZ0214-1]
MSAILKPIVLWTPTTTLTSDDACTSIYRYQLAPPPSSIRPPYHIDHTASKPLSYLPPLKYFCIKALVEWPDQVHVLGPAQLRYQAPSLHNHFDILQALIPAYRPFSPHHDDLDMRLVDPRLWAVLTQIYHQLPPPFRTYTLPLSDIHLPLLQRIPSTSHFSLITILSLSRCRMLTDDTVVELRQLHTLAALDASVTALGSWGVYRLARTLSWSDEEDDEAPQRRGPYGLRVLYLNNCLNIDNKVLSYLSRFPLLSVVDLRGTTCKPWLEPNFPFNASSDTCLYEPTNLAGVLAHLSSLTEKPSTLFSTRTPYILRVNSLYHKTTVTPHALPVTNPWDPYGEQDDHHELGMQVAKGRMDVFLPPEPDHYCNYSKPFPIKQEGGSGNPDELYSDEDEDTPIRRSGSASEHEDEDEDEGGGGDDDQPPGRWDMSNPQWGEDLAPRRVREEPQPVPCSWMDAAQDEMRIHRDRVSADRFYTVPTTLGLRRTSSVPSSAAARSHTSTSPSESTSTADPKRKPPDRLMLYRPPPPWSSLPSQPPPPQSQRRRMPMSVFESSSTAGRPSFNAIQPPPKRRQPADVAPADQARKRMRAITSMESIFSMVQKRSESATSATGKGKQTERVAAGPAGRGNPFARKQGAAKVPLSSVLKRLQPSVPAPPHAVKQAQTSSSGSKQRQSPKLGPSTKPQGSSRQPVDQEKVNANGVTKRAPLANPSATTGPTQTVESDAPLGPAKKLKPITTLPVPDWPGKPMKPLSEHKKRLQPPPPKAQKQTTLPATSTKLQRRVSAPMRLNMTPAKPEKGVNNGTCKLKSKDMEKQARQSGSGGNEFDWKGWSAS